ncbi:MAG: PrsW family intramembrane metalloprotease, partial [Calditrichaeota bacterium]
MRTLLLIAVLGFAPALFWLAYFYRKDRLEPEPRRLVLRTHLWGIFCAFPAAALEYLLPFNQWTMSVVGAPVVEESAKFLAVYLTIFRNPEFDEPMDGIVYGVAAALGFAALENVGYLYNAHTQYGSAALGGVFLVRGLLTVPAHA